MKTTLSFLFLSAVSVPVFSQTVNEAAADSVAQPDYDILDEVVVSAAKPVVTSDGAKTTYNVDEDPSSKGTNVLDMLRKVPMVTVDGEDNIRLKGQGNFKIYVNGREDPSISANASRIFKAMPAEAVSKVEVITEPGAKYDAEGTAGIINLITERKQKTDGYFGSVMAGINRLDLNGGINARMKYRNVGLSANVDYANGFIDPLGQNSVAKTEYLETGINLIERSHLKQGYEYLGGGINFSWEPNASNLFTVSGNLHNVRGIINDAHTNVSYLDRFGGELYNYNRDLDGKFKNIGLSSQIAYQHTFGTPGHDLIASYSFNYGNTGISIDQTLSNFSQTTTFTEILQKQKNDTFDREHTAQIDYTNPLGGGKHLLETGAKGIFRRNSSHGHTESESVSAVIPGDPSSRTRMGQELDIAAVYASYTGTFGSLVAKGGVRYEHTLMELSDRFDPSKSFSTRLNDWVPNAALTYMFGPASNLRASYQMRISRPSISQVNPYEMQIEAGSVRCGNPDLTSERSNQVGLTYSNFGRVLGGNIGVEYSVINNAISGFSYLEDGIIYETYANAGRSQTTTLNGFLLWNITQKMQFNVSGSLSYIDLKAKEINAANSGWNLNYNAAWSYRGPAGFNFNAWGGQSTSRVNLQGSFGGWYYYGLGFNRDFFKDKSLNIAVTANNFLQRKIIYKNNTVTSDTRNTSFSKQPAWRVGLNITWKFGSLKSEIKTINVDKFDDSVKTGDGGKKMGI